MRLVDFGMDTITLAGPLEAKLRAMRAAGFTQVMLSARDVVGHPDGEQAAIASVQASGLRVTGFQVLRDFEGLTGHLHEYRVDIAKSMLELCHALEAPLLLVCSSTSTHATGELDALAADLRKLAMLAVPLRIRVAYEALSWGRYVHQLGQAWAVVERARHANLGLCVDSFHVLATEGGLDALDGVDPAKVFLAQLSDFLWSQIRSREERIETARHSRVFPGEGVHNDLVAELVRRLDGAGYAGDYSFEVFNDDYAQMPLAAVCARAMSSVQWIASRMPRRSLPVLRGGRADDSGGGVSGSPSARPSSR
jgi:sugar phosphate isomerase/epimerase